MSEIGVHFLKTELPLDQYEHHVRVCKAYKLDKDELGYKYIFGILNMEEYACERLVLLRGLSAHIKYMEEKKYK